MIGHSSILHPTHDQQEESQDLGKSGSIVRWHICYIADTFLTTRAIKAAKEDDGKLLWATKHLRGNPDISLVLNGRDGLVLEVFADV